MSRPALPCPALAVIVSGFTKKTVTVTVAALALAAGVLAPPVHTLNYPTPEGDGQTPVDIIQDIPLNAVLGQLPEDDK